MATESPKWATQDIPVRRVDLSGGLCSLHILPPSVNGKGHLHCTADVRKGCDVDRGSHVRVGALIGFSVERVEVNRNKQEKREREESKESEI